jgi:hypothetical protein
MTPKWIFATGVNTEKCIDLKRAHPKALVGLLATHSLTNMLRGNAADDEDFVIFATGSMWLARVTNWNNSVKRQRRQFAAAGLHHCG